jgi:uncharacterized protein (DUF2132 family)
MNAEPLRGKSFPVILQHLVDHYGWEELGQRIPVNCFLIDRNMKSSLAFFRQNFWAKQKVEDLYIELVSEP